MSNIHLIKFDVIPSLNHNKLSEAEAMISNIRKEFDSLFTNCRTCNITADIHEDLYDRTVLILDWVGRLSMPLFAIRDDLEEQYLQLYSKSPKLAMKMFDNHYSKLHHPYNILKNRCYGILDDLDFHYEMKFNKKPRNWKPM